MKKTITLLSIALGLTAIASSSQAKPHAEDFKHAKGLSPHVLNLALNAYSWAEKKGYIGNQHYLTVVDFTIPSNKRRLWVLDLNNKTVAMHMHVAHGKGSGFLVPNRFSNQPNSNASSLGVYTTGSTYSGKHGRSMRLHGRECGVNNAALKRAVVVHGANYVLPGYIQNHGYTGRSHGCLAVNPHRKDQLINKIKGGSVIFAYAPEEDRDPRLTSS